MMVTVGISFYNAENTLTNAIRSVFAQDFQDWELILVDDGSTDNSLEIAKAVIDPRVRVISDGIKRNLAVRLNQIAREARSSLLARLDADDIISPRRLSRQLEVIQEEKIQIVTSGMAMLSKDYKFVGYRGKRRDKISMISLLRGHGIAHATILARTEWFLHNSYNENYSRSGDVELWCRTWHNGQLNLHNVAFIDEPLYFCREEAGVSLKKTLADHRILRSLIRAYGAASLKQMGVYCELLRSYINSGVLCCCGLVGLLPATRIRNRGACEPEMCLKVQAEIKHVLTTKVPGLD